MANRPTDRSDRAAGYYEGVELSGLLPGNSSVGDSSPDISGARHAYSSWSPFSGSFASGWETRSRETGGHTGLGRGVAGSYDDRLPPYGQIGHSLGTLEAGRNGGCFSYYGGNEDGLEFSQTVCNGKSLYAAAMNRWMDGYDGVTYDPFSTPEHSLQDLQSQQESCKKEEAVASAGNADSVRPSYSEVAKNSPTSPGNQHSKPESKKKVPKYTTKPEPHQPVTGSAPRATNSPPFRKHRFKTQLSSGSSTKGRGNNDLEGSRLLPNSRYGLDDFSDDLLRKPRSNSSDSIGGSRKGSTSSLSSGVEEILINAPPVASNSGMDFHGKIEIKQDVKDTSKLTDSTKNFSTKARPTTAPHKISSSPSQVSTASSSKPQEPFFDPRRIFQSKPRKGPSSMQSHAQHPLLAQNNKKQSSGSGLNNDKQKINVSQNSNMSRTTYINNDLRDKSDTRRNSSSVKSASDNKNKSATDSDTPKNVNSEHLKQRNASSAGSRKRIKESTLHRTSSVEPAPEPDPDKYKSFHAHLEMASHLMGQWWDISKVWGRWLLGKTTVLLIGLVLLLTKLTIELVKISYCLAAIAFLKVKDFVLRMWNKIWRKGAHDDWSHPSSRSARQKTYGMDENIPLPTTGNEAMKRLLACKGKDPYSILGLRADVADDEIKKYYRKQAILVHPDKNQQPGAEEAFKILKHAFELIGEPERRRQYDTQRLETTESERAWKEFSDLLTKLREKMQEAANTMRCDNCGGTHKRHPTDRPWYSARQCDRCNVRHSAKEGDVWAESAMLGFLWHYYACMEGVVYDITEWAKCQNNHFKHMQSNVHHVMYRIATNASRRQQGAHSKEAELNDFLNNLFHQGAPAYTHDNSHHGYNQTNANMSTTAPSQGRKKQRKKRK